MKDLLNNWLIQAIIGNVVCYFLSKFIFSFKKWLNTPIKTTINSKSNIPLYSKKSLRKQFYVSLFIVILSIPIFILTSNQFLKVFSFFSFIWFIFFMYCAFECSLDSFDDITSNRS